ncbi:hypothetical protein QBC32DRAFT_269889 [Pseudoneurospora amorphoporcata]|uniref:Uncharacterized protein n=1 Tax=Pseudoneurospora amorphoporcata TaxID=241081 RepID=A0AAN6NN63_9PEZI|nr:hypothetical protein QBC32DRAFT_269889 [Pseudoneurospora amorphoporcata]
MSGIKRNPSDGRSPILTAATSQRTANRETLRPTAPTALGKNPDPNPNSSPSQFLDLPTLTDTLPELNRKLTALAAVVSRGESVAVTEHHHSIPGASSSSSSSSLSPAEVADLQTCRAVVDISREVRARIRREVRLLTKEIHECSEVIRGRLVSYQVQVRNPRPGSKKGYGKITDEFRDGEGGGLGGKIAETGFGGPFLIGSRLSSFGTEESIAKVHGRSREDRRRGIQLEDMLLNSMPTLEKNSANGDDDVRFSPSPAQGHDGSYEPSTSGQPPPKHHVGDRGQWESTGVSGKNEEQLKGSGPSPESQKRQRVR